MGKCIAIANQKGGVGKTTLSANLAHNLAVAGFRVLLIDIDAQGNATSTFGVSKSQTGTFRFLKENQFFEEEIVTTEIKNLQVLPSGYNLRDFESQINSIDNQRQLLEAFENKLDRWDYILLDCPPSLGLLTANALALAHKLIIPVQPEFLAMEGLAQMVEAQKHIRSHINENLEIQGIVLNMTQPGQELSDAVEEELRDYFGDLVYKNSIQRDVVLAEAPSHGKSVLNYSPRSRGCLGMIEVTKEFLSRNTNKET